MTFGQSVATCFNKYAVFTGRASRSEYWWWFLFTFIVSFVVVFIAALIDEDLGNVARIILQLAFLLPNLAVGIRRCHDSNHSGWWVICPIVNIVMMFMPSDPSINEYGAPEDRNTETL